MYHNHPANKSLIFFSDKTLKKEAPVPGSRQSNKSPGNVKVEENDVKEEDLTEEESESEASTEDRKCCKICLFTIDFKSNRASERWLSCQACEKKAHVSCVEDTEHWTGFKLSKWQCNDCKSCVACKGSKHLNEVVSIQLLEITPLHKRFSMSNAGIHIDSDMWFGTWNYFHNLGLLHPQRDKHKTGKYNPIYLYNQTL